MPRKKLIYTSEYPYHVWARSNNKEWFYVPRHVAWNIFVEKLNEVSIGLNLQIHAFVLMDNHYHMLVTAHPDFNLGIVMQKLQRSVSREINRRTSRINHVFGGPYKASLIKTSEYFACVYKYVLRNPVEARLCERVEQYPFSTFVRSDQVPLSTPLAGMTSLVPVDTLRQWLNCRDGEADRNAIRKGLGRTVFKPTFERR